MHDWQLVGKFWHYRFYLSFLHLCFRQKTIKKKANLIAKTNHLLEMTERISDLKTKCSASQITLDLNNKAMGILKHSHIEL